ncbi:hypothetical protein [Microbacterium dauci]|uniref:Uncharacterized protein n=1 Tax=Microbacterium dauci TaxID=3048008 RepID=A0ABT6ZHN0_9MICO|nr:hypothetical protein [Microbacterium sp. LX3-4]MDJ1115157.1 hypothetical protein [Microbacterium sp. LX3-4]
MDDLSSRVRELAPDVRGTDAAVAGARRDLQAAIAAERSGRRRARASWFPRLPLSPAFLAGAVAAVLVVAIAVGALVSSQVFSKPQVAEPPQTVDLSQPLWDQLDGRVLRIATMSEVPKLVELPDGAVADEGSYLLVRSVSASYAGASGPWVSVTEDEPPEVLDQVGEDGPAMALHFAGVDERYRSEVPAATREWVDALPPDGDGIFRAFAERHGYGDHDANTDRPVLFSLAILPDPAWYFLSPAQRWAVIDEVAEAEGIQRSFAEGRVIMQWDAAVFGTVEFDGATFVPLAGQSGSWTPGLPGSSWTRSVSFVDAVPPEPPVDDIATTACGPVPIPESVFGTAGLDDTLNDTGREAIASAGEVLEPADWFAIIQEPDRVVLWTPVQHMLVMWSENFPPGLEGASHELLTLVRGEDGTWTQESWSPCLMTQVLPAHDTVTAELDPDVALDSDTTELQFLVSADTCATDPALIEVVQRHESADAVELLIAQRKIGAVAECQPATGAAVPFTVTLEAPLGDRAVVDLTYLEGRQLRR